MLHDVSLELRPREIVTIVGPNGAGKTTLLNCLLGLARPDRGEVEHAPALRVGYVPQKFAAGASLPLRVKDFLLLYAPHGQPRIDELASPLEIDEVLGAPLYTLSGGELRRVLLLRALMKSPQLLVLDEPTSGVDIAGQGDFYKLINRLAEQMNMAVLMVSHDLYVVMAATQRVICLNRHICCEGSPQRVGEDPKFRELFGNELANQLAMYHHHHDHKHHVHEERFAHSHTHAEGDQHG